ncbi:MAG: DUF1850 domain-containing protein [Pseudomonadota bacterium]
MTGFCLGVTSLAWLMIPTPEFTIAWDHSVEKIRWEEDYRVEGNRLHATAARVRGFGAGMEIPEGAVQHGNAWEYAPRTSFQDRLRLTRSSFTKDYQICWQRKCRTLTELLGPAEDGTVVEVYPCREEDTPPELVRQRDDE